MKDDPRYHDGSGVIVWILLLALIWAVVLFCLNWVEEIKTSREREELLLQKVKLMDYQIDVITNQVLDSKEEPK